LHSGFTRATIPQTQSHKKTLLGWGWQIPAAPGQEAFLTPYLTTVRTGTRGNSGFKSTKKYSIPSGKCWKALQITTKNLVQAFGSKMPGVRVSPLGPKALWSENFRGLLLLFAAVQLLIYFRRIWVSIYSIQNKKGSVKSYAQI
jgi:hypothetical protein